MKRVFIIHGWGGYPTEGWFPWLKAELIARGYDATVLAMPNADWPKIEEWVPYLAAQVGTPTADTSFVGHSIGCQTILRYLQTLPGGRVDRLVLVAPWVALNAEEMKDEESWQIATPWMETPIDWETVKTRAKKITAVFSNTDPFVPTSEAHVFRTELGAETVMLPGPGHFSGSDGALKLPVVLEALTKTPRP